MLTASDLNKIKEITRNEIKTELKKELKRYPTKDDLNKSLEKYATKDDLINFKDSILSEIIKLREDIEVVIGYRDMIEDHDQRIEKLETKIYQ